MAKKSPKNGVGLAQVFAACSIGLDENRMLSATTSSCDLEPLDAVLKDENADDETKAGAFYLRNAIGHFNAEAEKLVEALDEFLKKLNA